MSKKKPAKKLTRKRVAPRKRAEAKKPSKPVKAVAPTPIEVTPPVEAVMPAAEPELAEPEEANFPPTPVPQATPSTRTPDLDPVKRAERRAMIVLGSVAGMFVTILLLSFLVKTTKLDANYCPVDASSAPERATTVLVDLTDPVAVLKQGAILNAAKQMISTLEKHERFTLFVLRQAETREFVPVFSACNPGAPEWTDYLTKGRRQLQAQFEQGFYGTMQKALDKELASKAESLTSPIIESIRDIAQSQYWGRKNRLFIFSDLLEHSDLVSLYRLDETFEYLVHTPAKLVLDSIDLRDTQVSVCPTDHAAGDVNLRVQANALNFFKRFFTYTKASCLKMGCQKMTEACSEPQQVAQGPKLRP